MKIPELQEGERYAGIILNKNGTLSHHLILLPKQPTERLTWDGAMAWAISIGGNLPSRQEQALLFANCNDAFEPTWYWYWSSEQYAGNASVAWSQCFDNGDQYGYRKGRNGRARAVRRVYE